MVVNKNLYFKELKRNRKSFIVWSAIVFVFTVLVMSIFPYMKNIGDEMGVMMSKMPEGMMKAMGIDKDTFTSILGMYNTYYGIYIVVLLSIYTSFTGATIISKEEKYKTAEFLLTKPISRVHIFTTKLLSLFTLMFSAYTIQTITAVIFVIMFGENNVKWSVFSTMHIHGFILIIFFTCIGLFLSMWVKPKGNFMGITVGIVFGSYFLNTISKVAGSVDWLGYISPFRYLDFSISKLDYSTNVTAVFIMLLISMLLLFTAYKFYQKKDIHA